MATRWFGAPVQRTEDPRLLRGKGTYVDDIDLPEMLHAAVLRSPHARARILHPCQASMPSIPPPISAIYWNPLPCWCRITP